MKSCLKKIAMAFVVFGTAGSVVAQELSQVLELTSPGCSQSERSETRNQLCLPVGAQVGPVRIQELSRAGSSAASWSYDPVQSNCIIVSLSSSGSGQDCLSIFGNKVCNCRGRGWIKISVTISPR